ncbi:surface-adhesin E family protein [Ramlibacter humi]|uniref:Surface-adhesin protein E-like domain-containing protein n=1 Tax=Ramlibacter humi TaxID=2530451 RepID=A0A4Z0BWT0_9BURK|nr:surface-adhesin E family protein [Ramlibacter humi]TFZ03797.1 hypothetical protein EZ216_09080 [Ramlibacter humi]
MSRLPRVLACLSLAAAHAHADWVSYGESESGTYYFDPATVRSEGSGRKVWRLFELKEAKEGVKSGKALLEIDCKAASYRYLRTLYYSGTMGQGKVVGGAREQSTEPIGPGSMVALLSQKVCPESK